MCTGDWSISAASQLATPYSQPYAVRYFLPMTTQTACTNVFVGAATLCRQFMVRQLCFSRIFFCTTCMRVCVLRAPRMCRRIRAWEVKVYARLCVCLCSPPPLAITWNFNFPGCVCVRVCLLNLVGGKRDSIRNTAPFGRSNAPNPIRCRNFDYELLYSVSPMADADAVILNSAMTVALSWITAKCPHLMISIFVANFPVLHGTRLGTVSLTSYTCEVKIRYVWRRIECARTTVIL